MTRPLARALPLALLVALVAPESGWPGRDAGPTLVLTQLPLTAASPAALSGGTWPAPGGEGGRIVMVPTGGRPRLLTEGFASAADPEVSFDGTLIYFAGRRTAKDPWCVWVMGADGSQPRQITCGRGEARHPVDLPPMHTLNPTATDTWDQIGFVGSLPGETNETGDGPHTALFACEKDGSRLRRITFNLSSDADPIVLPDGRVVFASWQRRSLDRGPRGRVALFGLNTDGVDLVAFAADEGRRIKHMPAGAGDRLVVFVEGDEIEGDGSGSLGVVSLRRNLHSYRALSEPGDGLYHSPSTHPDGGVLASWRPSRDEGTFAVTRVDAVSGRRTPVFDDPGWHDVQARVLAPRPVPDHRSSSVRDDDPEGTLYGLDVSLSDLGRRLFPLGTARRLRVLEGRALGSAPGAPRPPLAPRRLLGEVDLDEDGSFQVQVPANTPLELQLLDEDGLALRTCGWIWVRNHEQRGCIGCHEDPERTPPNRHVKALDHPAALLNLPPESRRTVEFDRDVRPLVESRCLSCHGEGGAPPRLDAAAEGPRAAYRRLLASHVVPGRARTSPLVWHLLGHGTSRPWDPPAAGTDVKPMPALHAPLSPAERRTFIEWIDFGAAWGDETAPEATTVATGGGRR